uniref:Uncharacterized protein n=1 Tax=Rhizophora mucronata TaxID=61149 RepID=A0A2P2M205_RHIMU
MTRISVGTNLVLRSSSRNSIAYRQLGIVESLVPHRNRQLRTRFCHFVIHMERKATKPASNHCMKRDGAREDRSCPQVQATSKLKRCEKGKKVN